jgi:hypothetical protein
MVSKQTRAHPQFISPESNCYPVRALQFRGSPPSASAPHLYKCILSSTHAGCYGPEEGLVRWASSEDNILFMTNKPIVPCGVSFGNARGLEND